MRRAGRTIRDVSIPSGGTLDGIALDLIMAHQIELGVFLPVANNGWIISHDPHLNQDGSS